MIGLQDPRQLVFVPGDQLILELKTGLVWWVPQQPCIVLSRAAVPKEHVHQQKVEQDQIPLIIRQGGGGTVYLNSNTLCLALAWPNDRNWDVKNALDLGTCWVKNTLHSIFGISLDILGSGDLTYANKKIVGSSLRIKASLVHYSCSIILNSVVAEAERYLTLPNKQPDYRDKRSHRKFLTSLAETLGIKISSEQLLKIWQNKIGEIELPPTLTRDKNKGTRVP